MKKNRDREEFRASTEVDHEHHPEPVLALRMLNDESVALLPKALVGVRVEAGTQFVKALLCRHVVSKELFHGNNGTNQRGKRHSFVNAIDSTIRNHQFVFLVLSADAKALRTCIRKTGNNGRTINWLSSELLDATINQRDIEVGHQVDVLVVEVDGQEFFETAKADHALNLVTSRLQNFRETFRESAKVLNY